MKKGFTLVELISVIALLALISGAAAVSYVKIKNKQKRDACIAFKKNLENVAIETIQDLNKCQWYASDVKIREMVEYGNLKEEDLINPATEEKIPLTSYFEFGCDNNGNIKISRSPIDC